MFRNLSSFLMGVVVGAVGLYISMNYYIVRTNENVHLVPKVAAKLEMPYYDVRKYTLDDWTNHTSLGVAIIQSNNQTLISNTSFESVKQQFEGLFMRLKKLNTNF